MTKQLVSVAEKLEGYKKVAEITAMSNAYRFKTGDNDLVNQVAEAIQQRNKYKDALMAIAKGTHKTPAKVYAKNVLKN